MTTEERIKKIIFNAESVAHLKGFEEEILPLVDFTKELVRLVGNMNSMNALNADYEE
jgi:hypothetical protein